MLLKHMFEQKQNNKKSAYALPQMLQKEGCALRKFILEIFHAPFITFFPKKHFPQHCLCHSTKKNKFRISKSSSYGKHAYAGAEDIQEVQFSSVYFVFNQICCVSLFYFCYMWVTLAAHRTVEKFYISRRVQAFLHHQLSVGFSPKRMSVNCGNQKGFFGRRRNISMNIFRITAALTMIAYFSTAADITNGKFDLTVMLQVSDCVLDCYLIGSKHIVLSYCYIHSA